MPAVTVLFDRLDVDAAEQSRLCGLLAADELAHAARFAFARHRRRFIVRRGRLRDWLGVQMGTPPRRIAFAANPWGKPRVVGWDRHFSTSHSGETMMFAHSPVEIGCDIEAVDPALDWRPLADGLFAPAERAALAALSEAEGRPAFFRCWARKEAFVKALGTGLSHPLDAFDVATGPEPALHRGGRGYTIAAPSLPGHACALVARADGDPFCITQDEA